MSMNPPYVAYATFKNTVQRLAPDGKLPTRIDNSVLGGMSGAARSQFVGALKFFGLVDDDGAPSDTLQNLAASNDADWKERFAPIVKSHYTDVQLTELKSGSPNSLQDTFGDADSSIKKPAVRFFVKAAQDTGIMVGSHIAKPPSTNGGTRPSKRKTKTRTARKSLPYDSAQSSANGVMGRLLDKFPEFNPEWGEEQQRSWFSAYEKLLGMTGGETNEKKGGSAD